MLVFFLSSFVVTFCAATSHPQPDGWPQKPFHQATLASNNFGIAGNSTYDYVSSVTSCMSGKRTT
jgi:hypothetical protein